MTPRERSIILRPAEVLELLANGRATLRRPVKGARVVVRRYSLSPNNWENGHGRRLRCPFGAAGTRLACREGYTIQHTVDGEPPSGVLLDGRPIDRDRGDSEDAWSWQAAHYRATDPPPDLCCESPRCHACGPDGEGYGPHWLSAATMPRWAVRLYIVTRSVRVEAGEWVAEVEGP